MSSANEYLQKKEKEKTLKKLKADITKSLQKKNG